MSIALQRLGVLTAACAAAGVLGASCVSMQARDSARAEPLAMRIEAALARRGLGSDALSVIDNILRHDAPPPPFAPPIVRELLAQPFAAADAERIFYRTVPGALRRFLDDANAPLPPAPEGSTIPLRELLDVYVGELVQAQALIKTAASARGLDARGIARELGDSLPSAEQLRRVAAEIDQARMERATNLFLNATRRFVRALRAAGDRVRFPDQALRYDSPIGVVSIGTRGDDFHAPAATVIIDPGGNDVYERAPATGGAISVIVDLVGDDRYIGSDLVVHGLSAIVDFSGDDRYTVTGPGLGAAIAGAAVIVDFAGDDTYEVGLFGEGAAAFGLGAIVDLGGNDRYTLRAGGQGFGLAGGVGLLWDGAGNDRYAAAGLPDAFNRGGGLSAAQGSAFGFRTRLGGGIGILRDDSGDDIYEAEMFAQGTAYYLGVGLLWDRGGEDHYRAVRYAQGNGVHEAVGVLIDESGDDRYELGVGVGQGMGLDLAVGVLADGAGDDRYQAPSYAQGAATANGVGILRDSGGADRWQISSADRRSWGRAEWLRGLPSIGLLLYDPTRAAFAREGKPVLPPPGSAELGGPLGGSPIAHEPAGKSPCATIAPSATEGKLPLAESLRKLETGFVSGSFDPEIYADVQLRLTRHLRAGIAMLPDDDFNVMYSFAGALRCALEAASGEDATLMWTDMERLFADEPATPFAGAIAGALRERPAGAAQMARLLPVLEAHPYCSVRAAALRLRSGLAFGDAARATIAKEALRSPCWRLQVAAFELLKRLGLAPDAGVALPSFFRTESLPRP